MDLQVAQLEAQLHNRPIDLRDKVQAEVQVYVGQLFQQYQHEVRNKQWRLADQTSRLIEKIDEHSQRQFDIRESLIAKMGLE